MRGLVLSLKTSIAIQQDNEITHPKLQSDPAQCEEDFLWGWLNVNTRCLYHRLEQSPSDKNNVTMCPIIDFANHTSGSNHMAPRLSNAVGKTPLKTRGRDFTVLSPSSSATKRNDELFLTYGAHSNHTLFVEYGFTNEASPENLSCGDVIGEISIDAVVIELFESRGELGGWMKGILQSEGYWG
ncbi:hypothetical protein H0H87_000037 [Tephrocybe sp. NHM501043]|nr:hypothetical protein H0H87_000037 [Tephrocybe sp. NHM501043]